MTKSFSDIPALPTEWPFERRAPGAAPVLQNGIDIPGQGSGWTLIAAPGLDLSGETKGLVGAFGRGGIQRLGDVVLRPYRRGGLVRHLNSRIYLSPARFAREFLVHRALWLAGFPTVEPLGYAVRRRAFGVEGVFLTRHADCEPWPRQWALEGDVLGQLRARLDALCAWGLYSPDLNATNVMLTPFNEVLLLDWDRADFGGTGLLARYCIRLLRSLEKLNAPREIIQGVTTWEATLDKHKMPSETVGL